MEIDLPSDPAPAPGTAPGQFSAEPITAAGAIPAGAQPTLVAPPYRDRGTGLQIFGVLQVILGLFAALMVPLVVLGAFMSRLAPGGTMRPGQYVSGVLTYACIAAGLIGLGIGSVQMKRWAHALTLVVSCYWLVMGALLTILLTAALPMMMRHVLAQAQHNAGAPSIDASRGVMAVLLTLIIVFAAFFLVLTPIAFIAFYGRKDVAETCRHRDPVERWTDRTPLPVLGASVVLFAGSLYSFMIGLTTPLFPFFGHYLTGILATACFVTVAAIDLYVSIALFRLQAAGWWTAIVTMLIRFLSMVLTYQRADLMRAYSKIGMSNSELQMLNANPMFRSHIILWWSLISMVLFFGYLLWLKRYFKDPAAAQTATLPTHAA